jgi:hypothetical protein
MNWDTHFYLYAKGHYQETDLVEDLKKIFARRSMVPLECCQPRDAARALLELAWKHITESGNPEYHFIEFIDRLNPVDIFGKECWSGRDGFWKVLLENCLSVLRFTKVAGLDLGKADPEILPLKSPANKAFQATPARRDILD